MPTGRPYGGWIFPSPARYYFSKRCRVILHCFTKLAAWGPGRGPHSLSVFSAQRFFIQEKSVNIDMSPKQLKINKTDAQKRWRKIPNFTIGWADFKNSVLCIYISYRVHTSWKEVMTNNAIQSRKVFPPCYNPTSHLSPVAALLWSFLMAFCSCFKEAIYLPIQLKMKNIFLKFLMYIFSFDSLSPVCII